MRTLALLALLCSCSVPGQEGPTAEELASAEYGSPPALYEARVRAHALRRYPGLVRVDVGAPTTSWYGQVGGITATRDIRFGWAVPFQGYRLGGLGRELAMKGYYFFHDDELQGIADPDGFRFVSENDS